jgi:hypothetical protein
MPTIIIDGQRAECRRGINALQAEAAISELALLHEAPEEPRHPQ